MRPFAFLVALSAVLGAAAVRPAAAHDETVSSSEVEIGGREVVWKVDVGVLGLEKAIKFPAGPLDLSERDLEAAKPAIARYLAGGLVVKLDGKEAAAEPGALEPRTETFIASGQPYIARVAMELRYRAAEPIRRVDARVQFFSELTRQHRAVVTARWKGEGGREEVRQLVRLGVADIDLSPAQAPPGRWAAVREFLLWGMEHIFIGYDHIAFLIALLLVAARLGELVKIVTSFTAAHSLTLLLAALEVVRFPSQATEVLIAASIVYVSGENLWRARRGLGMSHRWWLTFCFGLVHGLGFATQLRERLEALQGSLVVPVLSFNLGVELGQLAIVATVFPLLILLRRTADAQGQAVRQLRLVRWGSVPILLLGLGWLIERLMAS